MSDVRSMLASIVPICGNCRFIRHDEHGGGRNVCDVIGEEKSERYKYAMNHTCDVLNDYGQRGFQPDYFHLDGVIEALIGSGNQPATTEALPSSVHGGCTCPLCCPEKWAINRAAMQTVPVREIHRLHGPFGASLTVSEVEDVEHLRRRSAEADRLVRELATVTAKWRETADVWERHNADYRQVPKGLGYEMAPQHGVGAIKNWINWLRGCANTVDAVLGSGNPATPEQAASTRRSESAE